MKARKVLPWWLRRSVPGYRFRFELATAPDQYRLIYALWDERRGPVETARTLRLTLTPEEFFEWQAWLDGGKC